MRFDDKVVIVTGGAFGIGRAAADIFAERGASVAILDWDETAGAEAEGNIKQNGGNALFQKVDVSNADDVQTAVDTAHAAFGRVDSLVVSAGIQRYGTAVATDAAPLDEGFDVNLIRYWNAAEYAVPVDAHARR